MAVNKMFWAGFGMMSVQLLAIMLYLFSTLSFAWLTADLIKQVAFYSVIALFNISSVIFMIVGAFRK